MNAAELNAKALEAWNRAFDFEDTPENLEAINASLEEADRLWARAERITDALDALEDARAEVDATRYGTDREAYELAVLALDNARANYWEALA